MLKHEGRLRQKELEARQVKLRMEGLVSSIRDLLDPFEEIEALRADVAAGQAVELASLQATYKGLLGEMAAIKKALGR